MQTAEHLQHRKNQNESVTSYDTRSGNILVSRARTRHCSRQEFYCKCYRSKMNAEQKMWNALATGDFRRLAFMMAIRDFSSGNGIYMSWSRRPGRKMAESMISGLQCTTRDTVQCDSNLAYFNRNYNEIFLRIRFTYNWISSVLQIGHQVTTVELLAHLPAARCPTTRLQTNSVSH